EETGLYYLMARYYEPRNGVFLSLDPDPGSDGDSLDQNGYAYGNNNPVMNVDPDGHWVWLVVNAGFAAYDGYKAYKSGKGWKGAAWAAASNFGPGKIFKGAKRAYSFAKIASKRRSAVKKAWQQERDLIIRTGKGTRKWSNKRKAEIVRKGKAKGIIGHHINNVKHHPRLAGNPNNIRFVTRKEHYRLHHNGKWRKKTTGKMIKR
ncbi:Wall associated protein, partial [Bacillus spizizenii]|nr:Wall associated protein [Bacillus spizizenii]